MFSRIMKRLLAIVALLTLGGLLLAACEDGGSSSGTTPTTAAVEDGMLAFETIEQGDQSGIQDSAAVLEVARTQEEWQDLWSRHRAGRRPETEPPPVDFDERMVVAVIDGQQPTGGHTLYVTGIEVVGERLVVRVERSVPGEACVVASVLTWPFHIVETEYSDLEAGFDVTETVFECG